MRKDSKCRKNNSNSCRNGTRSSHVMNVLSTAKSRFELLKGDNKELMIIPGASHVDLYDNFDAIPFDKLEAFFWENLA